MIRNETIMVSAACLIAAATVLRIVTVDKPSQSIVPSKGNVSAALEALPEPRKIKLGPLPRPLFSLPPPINRDVTGSIPSASKGADPSLPVLLGIIVQADQRTAVVRHDGKIKTIRETDQIGPWTVTRIDTRTALLRQGDHSEELFLDPTIKN